MLHWWKRPNGDCGGQRSIFYWALWMTLMMDLMVTRIHCCVAAAYFGAFSENLGDFSFACVFGFVAHFR